MNDRCGGNRDLSGGQRTTFTSYNTWITWMEFSTPLEMGK